MNRFLFLIVISVLCFAVYVAGLIIDFKIAQHKAVLHKHNKPADYNWWKP